MKGLTEIKTWEELIKFIINDKYGMNFKEIAIDVLGISSKSFYDIKKGKIPKKQLYRKISGYIKDKYNLEIKKEIGANIKLKQSIDIAGNNNVIKDSQKYNLSSSNEAQKNYLLNRVIELENRIIELENKIKELRNKK